MISKILEWISIEFTRNPNINFKRGWMIFGFFELNNWMLRIVWWIVSIDHCISTYNLTLYYSTYAQSTIYVLSIQGILPTVELVWIVEQVEKHVKKLFFPNSLKNVFFMTFSTSWIIEDSSTIGSLPFLLKWIWFQHIKFHIIKFYLHLNCTICNVVTRYS